MVVVLSHCFGVVCYVARGNGPNERLLATASVPGTMLNVLHISPHLFLTSTT